DLDYQIAFTLNAGRGPRVAGAWTADNARSLVELATSRGDPVALWELGNEINLYLLQGGDVPPATYAADLATARAMLDAVAPGQRLAGPSSAYWPRAGEIVPYYAAALAAGATASLDVITWHYYPTQSERCPFVVLRALPKAMLDPANLDEA